MKIAERYIFVTSRPENSGGWNAMAIPTTINEITTAKKTRPISFGVLRDKALRRFCINKPIRANETITKSSRNILRLGISNFTAARTTSYV